MTTLAYRDGVLAADRDTKHNGVVAHETTKIGRRADGVLVGTCGVASMGYAFRQWVLSGEHGDRPPLFVDHENDINAIVVRPSGGGGVVVEIYDRCGFTRAEGEFFALGGGFEIALGAMDHGASAAEAVRYAARRGVGRVDAIDVLRMDGRSISPDQIRTRERAAA